MHKCTQGDTETVTEFIATLRSLSLNCGYANDVLSDTLRDIFIVGLRSQHIQRELISKPDTLTFADACATAKKLEAASTEVSKLSGKRAPQSHVHKVFSRKGANSNTNATHTRNQNTVTSRVFAAPDDTHQTLAVTATAPATIARKTDTSNALASRKRRTLA